MNTRLIKLIGLAACTATAFGLGSQLLVISSPENPDDYGIGTYRVEGVLNKNVNVKVALDNKEVKSLTTNSEDGQYDVDIEVANPGKHTLMITYKDSKGKDVFKKLEFSASRDKMKDAPVEDPGSDTAETHVASKIPEPDDKNTDSEVPATLMHGDLVSEDPVSSADPNSPENRKASGVHDANLKSKSSPKTAPKLASPKALPKNVAAKGKFVISSHTNFNVVPTGIIMVGGKGNPGDKIMLLVDSKPSMRGTIKSNGRWSFPVKISKPGFRKITAQDLRSREAKTIKLKIK
jgi:hypothetical protein